MRGPAGRGPDAAADRLDLTTQAPADAQRCAELAAAAGSRYHGGGLSAGGRELRAGRAVLLLGPPVEPGTAAAAVIDALGRAIPFRDPAAAARAKVLHNWVLLAQQWAAALALADAREHGIDRLAEVLDAGTAGRPVPEWSVVRDAADAPTSTYLARLAAKDLAELARAAPGLAAAAAPLLPDLAGPCPAARAPVTERSSEPRRPPGPRGDELTCHRPSRPR